MCLKDDWMAFNKHDLPPSLLRPLIFYPSKGFSNIGKNTLYFLKMGEPISHNCSQSPQIEFVPGNGALTSVCARQNCISFSTYEGRCCLWSHKALPYQKPKLKGVYSSSHIFHQTILIFVQMWLTDAPLEVWLFSPTCLYELKHLVANLTFLYMQSMKADFQSMASKAIQIMNSVFLNTSMIM